MENEKATILWDSQIITDRHVPCNKPDIVIQEKKSDRCQIIDVAIPSDYNMLKKATEKTGNYVDLQIECQRLWNKKVEVIPAIIGATGIVDKNIKKYVDVGFSFCLVLIVWLNQVQNLRNRIKFLSFHKLSPVNLTWLSQVYGKMFFFPIC